MVSVVHFFIHLTLLLLQIHMNKDNKILHIGRIQINYHIKSVITAIPLHQESVIP